MSRVESSSITSTRSLVFVSSEAPSTHQFTSDVGGRLTQSTNRFYTGVLGIGAGVPEVMTAPPSQYAYRLDGRLSRVTNADGTHDFTYDERGLIRSQLVNQGAETANVDLDKYPAQPSIADRCYNASYDAVGNVVRLTDPEGSDDIVVDELDRLRSVTRSDGTVETYAYNALGALTLNAGVAMAHQRPRLGGGGNADAAVPATLGGQPVTLDRGGFVTSLGGVGFAFSRDGYLRSTTEGSRFAIDTSRRRAWQLATGYGLEAFAYEGANLIGVVHQNYLPSTGLPAQTVDERWLLDGIDHPLRLTSSRPFDGSGNPGGEAVVLYFELDLAGNVRRIRGANGEDYGGYRYTAFGQTVEDTATAILENRPRPIVQRLRWKGRPIQHFGGTEVYDMRARQWVPELGSFLSIDELSFHDSKGTLWSWPRQNPIRYRDPSGHDEGFPPAVVIIGGIIGGAATVLGFGMSAPSDTSAAPADLVGMMSSVPGPAIARLLLEEAASRVPGLGLLLKAPSKSRFGPLSSVDCRAASQNLIEGLANPADAKLLEMTAKNGSKLPHNWEFHAAVELADGSVLDPKLGVSFPSAEAWVQGTAGGADVLLSRSPYPRPPLGPPLPGDGL